jgi:hypothetical protein
MIRAFWNSVITHDVRTSNYMRPSVLKFDVMTVLHIVDNQKLHRWILESDLVVRNFVPILNAHKTELFPLHSVFRTSMPGEYEHFN